MRVEGRTGGGGGGGAGIRRVVRRAVFSRFLVAALFLLWRILASPYDTSATLNPPCLGANQVFGAGNESSVKWKNVGAAIENLVVWDAVYYIRIAECGYEYEQTHAFFPALPLLTRFLANNVFISLAPLVGHRAVLTMCGLLVTNVAFVFAALYLYKVTMYVVEEEDLAWRAVCLFCFNPASVFYSAIYSESLFALCSFAGLWQFVTGKTWTAALIFGLSSGVRSNGVLHAGFFLFQAMHCAYEAAIKQGRYLIAVQTVFKAISQSLVTIIPMVLFQGYGYYRHCGLSEGRTGELDRPWCNARIPYLYGFVQDYYWNVGFLRYFQVKQIPNFLLASPVLILAIAALSAYGRFQPRLLFLLGFNTPPSQWRKLALLPDNSVAKKQVNKDELGEPTRLPGLSALAPDAVQELRHRRGIKTNTKVENTCAEDNVDSVGGFYSPAAVCFLVQLAAMVFVATCIMHVQVATRFLSVSPPIYWYAAHAMKDSVKGLPIGRITWTYYLSFFGLGSLLFFNFYPFT
ncbi:hypothetical protein M758_2G225300 [Ceratodon purpureus]|nr:hypothetical protein M758_2G225300 [Ceratodon purpureus]